MNNLLNTKLAIDGKTETPGAQPVEAATAPTLAERLDEVSVNSDCGEYLFAIRELATATAAERRAVAAWCDVAIAEMDANCL